jgi:hypothetical protein
LGIRIFFRTATRAINLYPRVSQDLKVKAGVTQVQGNFWKDRIFKGGTGKAKIDYRKAAESQRESHRRDPTRMIDSQGGLFWKDCLFTFVPQLVRINGKFSVPGQC